MTQDCMARPIPATRLERWKAKRRDRKYAKAHPHPDTEPPVRLLVLRDAPPPTFAARAAWCPAEVWWCTACQAEHCLCVHLGSPPKKRQ